MIGVYAIRCRFSRRSYIGSSVNINSRIKSHFTLLNKGEHVCGDMQSDFEQFGSESFSFDVLKECREDELASCESVLISNEVNPYNKRKWVVRTERRPPVVGMKNITIRMPVDLIKEVEEAAKKSHRSFTGQVIHILYEAEKEAEREGER